MWRGAGQKCSAMLLVMSSAVAVSGSQEFGGRLRFGFSSAFRVLQSITFAGGFNNRAAVGESIKGGSGEPFVAEHFGPVFETEVGGEHDAGTFVSGGNHVEEEFGPGLAGGDVAQLIENQQIEFGQVIAETQELSFLIGFA